MTPERRLDILTGARALIADERRWGQGTLEQHPILDRLMMRPPRVCLVGAVMHAVHGRIEWSTEVDETVHYLGALVPAGGQHSAYGQLAIAFNDKREHRDVIELLDLAILGTEVEISSPPHDEQDQGDDREHDENRPQHDRADTPVAGG